MKISAQVLVENEENFVWYSIMSVLPYVDEVRIVNAGSRDNTFAILQSIQECFPKKVILSNEKKLSQTEYPLMRQRMLKATDCDWILVVDGDEIWWDDTIQPVVEMIRTEGTKLDSIVTPFVTCIGDMYHIQSNASGKYRIDGQQGHLTIRAINKAVPQLQVKNMYPHEGYFSDTVPVQDLSSTRRAHMLTPCFMHMTYLKRTSIHTNKVKRAVGVLLPGDFFYPEVLFKKTPDNVLFPFRNQLPHQKLIGSLSTIARSIKHTVSR